MSSISLHDAVRNESIEDVKRALLSSSDTTAIVNAVDSHNRTALHLAAWKNNITILNILLSFKANIYATAMDNFTVVHFAAQNVNGSEFIRILIKKDRKLLDQRIKKDHKTALHLAVAKGNKDVVRCLLELGADVLAKTNTGRTPSDFVKNGDEEMKEILQMAVDQRIKKKDENNTLKINDDNNMKKINNNRNNNNNNDNNNNDDDDNNNKNNNDNNKSVSIIPVSSDISNKIRINLDSDDDDDDDDDNNNNNNNVNHLKRSLDRDDDNLKDVISADDDNEEKITVIVKTGVMKKRKIILSHLENDDDDDDN